MAKPLGGDDFSSADNTSLTTLDYTPTEKSAIIWAVAIGTIVGTFPVNYFYTKYGASSIGEKKLKRKGDSSAVFWQPYIFGYITSLLEQKKVKDEKTLE
ncbi:hypothetical protein ANCDUO_09418 [Ancylostoma duodenale]|uniref:Uncharacterized protein n=1 Tax=Ancylostoma duodenale TaxID=51022 RepID=A0A0C2CTW1_9BILA|nr:hypothetical protein ANCDUO_09418 [Ancylostoma duodenale]